MDRGETSRVRLFTTAFLFQQLHNPNRFILYTLKKLVCVLMLRSFLLRSCIFAKETRKVILFFKYFFHKAKFGPKQFQLNNIKLNVQLR